MAHTQGPWVVKFQESKSGRSHYTDKYWHDQWVIKGPDKKHSPVATVRVAGYGMGPSMGYRHFLQHMERDWFDDDDQDVMQQMFEAINKSRENSE